MANKDTKIIPVGSRWCFVRNELVITFADAQLASEYQRSNSEGRIFANLEGYTDKDVYLPRPEGLLSIRSSSLGDSYSLVLEFGSEKEARAWDKKVLIGLLFENRSKNAYIDKRSMMPNEAHKPSANQKEQPLPLRTKPVDRFKQYHNDKSRQ